MTVTSASPADRQLDATRGERTRSAILDASRRLFLERGYAGTPIFMIVEKTKLYTAICIRGLRSDQNIPRTLRL